MARKTGYSCRSIMPRETPMRALILLAALLTLSACGVPIVPII
ncbi:MAG: hypothetical protein AAGF22_06505 [Pseudomonadota bacterium]